VTATKKAQAVLADLQKSFGEDAIMMGSDIPVGHPISTGSLALDFATGYGGFPSNRVVEICGKEGTGKTTLALIAMVNALKHDPERGALFLDTEHKLDKAWLTQIVGEEIMNERLMYVQPTSIENATNIYRKALQSGLFCAAILDSIGGSPTIRRNDDAEVGHYGGNSIGVGEFARAAATHSSIYECMTIGVNQTRADMSGYNRLNRPGGMAWQYHIIQCIELVRGKDTDTISMPGEEKPVPIGYTIHAKVRKNQVGAPGRTALYWFYNTWTEEHGFGIDQLDEIGRLAIKTQVVEKKGGWYHHPALPLDAKGDHKVQGLLGFQTAVKADEALKATIVSEVLASLKDAAGDAIAPLSDPDAEVDIEQPTGMEKIYVES
jgi:recombination protein RecA